MKKLRTLGRRFWGDEAGLELSEYAVMAGIIILLAIGVILTLGGQISDIFQGLSNQLANVPTE